MRLDYDQIALEVNDSSWACSDGAEEGSEVRLNVRKTYCHEAGHSLGFFHQEHVAESACWPVTTGLRSSKLGDQ